MLFRASEIKLNVPYIRQDDENNEYPISFDDLLNDFAQGSYKFVTKGEILDI